MTAAAWDLGAEYAQRANILPTLDAIMTWWKMAEREAIPFSLGYLARRGRRYPPQFREVAEWKLRERRDRLDDLADRIMSAPDDGSAFRAVEAFGLDQLREMDARIGFVGRCAHLLDEDIGD